jgi:hypothetical protein
MPDDLLTLIATTPYENVKQKAASILSILKKNPDACCTSLILNLLLMHCAQMSLSACKIRERQRERRNDLETQIDEILHGPNREPA